MPQRKIILKAQHGSHLYGLANSDSDLDFYIVYDFPWQIYRPRKQSEQKINEEEDATAVSLERFTDFCLKGIPQSLETLFSDSSQWLEYDNSWYHESAAIKTLVSVNIPSILETYRRTAWNFFSSDNFKKNRHAMRLCLNALDLKKKGYFNPTLEHGVIKKISDFAALPWVRREEVFKDVLYDTFGDV